ncbi:MAG: glycosyl hydrolase family 18 protein [Bacillota bacterium]|nr:glycosyl hydrolase family 18 protein [Bacillota bacterium]
MEKGEGNINKYNTSSKLRFHRSFWVLFLSSLFFIVMIIPSIIVFSAGKGEPFKEILNGLNQKQTSTKSQKSIQKSPLTIGWLSGNNQSLQHISDYKNLNVISPALGSIDDQFNLQANSDSSLTNTIHTKNKMVWARIVMNNDTKTNVHAFLTNQNKVQEFIKQIHQSALKNDWNGINLDIENVSAGDREAFSQFIINLSHELNKTSIILSIDLPPDQEEKGNQQSPFDHKVIGEYCNYVVFMGYDQHWSTDPVPGPVTSLSWLKQNLQEFIQTGISSEKIILGLPAYTRIWEQNQQGSIVKDPAEPIQYVEDLVKQNHRNLSWDSTLGEYYTSYDVNNLQYKVWLPTVKSFNIYLNLISQFQLGGSAVWNLDFMNPSYWNQIYSN